MTSFIARAGLVAALALSACSPLEPHVVGFNDQDVEVVDVGDGPAVVLEAGLGDDWKHWRRLATDLSEDTRVFAYSRPGYGHSADATTPRDPATIVDDLHELLLSRDIAPPYVMVGHSFGGTYMELFARTYPEDTAALVLVDSRPINFLVECEAAGFDMCGVPAASVEAKGGVFAAEYDAFHASSAEFDAAGPLGSYPVRVMTAARHPGASPEYNELWTSMHAGLAAEAPDGEQILVDGPHYLQVYREEEVAAVVREVLPR